MNVLMVLLLVLACFLYAAEEACSDWDLAIDLLRVMGSRDRPVAKAVKLQAAPVKMKLQATPVRPSGSLQIKVKRNTEQVGGAGEDESEEPVAKAARHPSIQLRCRRYLKCTLFYGYSTTVGGETRGSVNMEELLYLYSSTDVEGISISWRGEFVIRIHSVWSQSIQRRRQL